MIRTVAALFAPLIAACIATSAFAAPPDSGAGLEAYRGKARPVVIFAPDHGDRQTIDQLERLKSAAFDLADRDMPVLIVTGGDVADLAGTEHAVRPDGGRLRKDFGVEEGRFAVVLVGKDGTEKLKTDTPIEPSRLIGAADATSTGKDAQMGKDAHASTK